VTAPIAPDAALVRQLAATVGLALDDERIAQAQPILAAQLAIGVPAELLVGIEPATHFDVDWA